MVWRDLFRIVWIMLIMGASDLVFSWLKDEPRIESDHLMIMAIGITILCAIREKD